MIIEQRDNLVAGRGRLWTVALVVAMGLTGCATMEPVTPLGVAARDRTVRMQIFLDGQHFGPGVVDGHSGEFTDKALAFYQQSHGLPEGDVPDVSMIEPYTQYQVTATDRAQLGVLPADPAEIAKLPKLAYTSLTELLAERFHTTQAFLRDLNRGVAIDELQPGAVITAPNVRRPLVLKDFPVQYAKVPAAAGRHVVVDTQARMLEVRDGAHLVAAFPITPGSPEHPAPMGDWHVIGAVPWPWYRYDEGVLERGERTKVFYNFAPGPNSPVGILWTGLNHPGVGIHGTGYPETIGRTGSHGCIRLANWDAAVFYTFARKDLPVTIR